MEENNSQDSIDQIASDMVKEIELAEEKDKEVELSQEMPDQISEDSDSPEETEVDDKKKKDGYQKKKLNTLRRENERILEEARLIAEENIALRNQYEAALSKAQTSGDAAMAHYQNGINLRITQLKEELKKAHELNDIDSITDINLEMGMLASEAKDVKAHNLLQQQYQQQQYQNPYPYQYPQNYVPQTPEYAQGPSVNVKEETKDWVKRNPWLIHGHDDYDPEKVEEVLAYSKILDLNLQRNGREDQIHSPDYYNALDQYVNQTFGHEVSQPQYSEPETSKNREPSFSNNSRAPIAPVRKSSPGNYNKSPHSVKLSDVDKEMMKQFERYGVTPESYAKAKIQTTNQYKKAAEAGDLNALQNWGLI